MGDYTLETNRYLSLYQYITGQDSATDMYIPNNTQTDPDESTDTPDNSDNHDPKDRPTVETPTFTTSFVTSIVVHDDRKSNVSK